tara:strand:- start:598 stop:2808 length:2211 start_codon:yes stop_codon:yes gene_type:complete
MSRARELAKVGGKNQQVIAGLSSHVGVSTFLNNVHMFANLDVGGNVTVTGTTTFNGGTLTLGDANTDNIVFGGEVDSHIIPDDDGTYDLGSSTKEWRNLYIDGTAQVDALTVDADASVAGNFTLEGGLDARGNVDLGNATSDTITATGRFDSDLIPSTDGARDLGSSSLEWQDLYIDGTANIDSLVADTADINGGTVDGAAIGGNSASTGAFTTISASGNVDFNGDLDVDGTTNLDVVDIDGAVDMASNLVIAGNIDANGNLDVDGTTDLDATNVVGTLTVTGDAAIDNVTVNGNTVSTSSGNLTIDSAGGTTTIADNTVISGNLTVNGTTTTINSTTVEIDDKNFQVATGAADDSAADGAGFTVDSGDGDKTWNFEATGDNWGSSENINLASGKVLKVNNTSILSSTTLGSSVVSSSLTSLGTIGTGVWQGTAINDTYLGTIDNANKVSLSALNIDGGTDIGAALVNTDEIIVDDGGGGTNRRCDMSRVKTYIYAATSGDATASSSGAITLAASGVSAATYGSSTAIPILTVDAKGRVTSATTTAVDSTTIENGSASVAVASNGPITSTGNHDFTAGIDVTGNITVSGTVDGRDVATDGSKLDGIESAATADQTASEILTLIKTVDGAGSGLDADTLDGISSASFLRSDTSDTFTGTLTVSGNIVPNANGTRDLGTSSTRWQNIYTSDVDLNNQAKGGNTIDGSWGSYLIEEGENDLFLKNRRSGKTYKFMLQEV